MPTVVTFPLADAITAQATAAERELGAPPYALRGVIAPFQRDEKNDFANEVGVELIRSNVRQVIGTVGASDTSPGEIRWLTEFGSQVYTLRHSNMNEVLDELARVFVVEALRRWEPRVRVTDTKIEKLREARRARITVLFDIVDLQAPATTIVVPNLVEQVEVALAA